MSNRLKEEDSPYLQHYKDDLIDWWPWCDEAFETAKKEKKAIFISIGYSSCHWCHVMKNEIFTNEEVIQRLNKNFISIKVDREERPDIDRYYQEVHFLLNQRAGGWPTSIFCTPENKPFFAGTYIPLESDQESIEGMGFKELTKLIAHKVKEQDYKLFENADEIEQFLNKVKHPTQATVLKEEFYKNLLLQAKDNYDTRNGGFSDKPKFPHVNTLYALLNIDKLYGDKAARAMVNTTLTNMIKGGMYDLVDGGFCRYSTDEKWFIPHFEKMLYDNALLCNIYTKAYLAYNNEKYLKIAKEIADFIYNFMSEDELFYSASDADSNLEEGSYFTYTYEEVYQALIDNSYDNAKEICELMNISKDGNFNDKNIIRFEENIPEWFNDIRIILQKIRSKRDYPFIDKKIQTSWSAMMINSLFELGTIDTKYYEKAKKAIDKLMTTIYKEDKLYHTVVIGKKLKIEAFLEDYAFLSKALLSAFKYTQDEFYLISAQRFANKALEKFYEKGMWKFSDGDFNIKEEISDATYTSSIGIMVDVLLTLSTLLEDNKYKHFAFKTMEYNSYEIGRKPIYSPYITIQIIRYLKGDKIIKTSLQNISNNSLTLSKIKYPFLLFKKSNTQNYMVCGEKSCFANTNNIEEIENIIDNL